ncbi:PAAR domain-containing protein, partial [Tabrizicola sp.]|uniref:PAAR domain-containing protein n=1 Tax=Tabrizicola sp. TaxID=2005166 RepID=UPI003F2D1493
VGGTCTCIGPPDTMNQGSSVVKIMGKGVVRMGDGTAHGGKLVMGVPTVRAD